MIRKEQIKTIIADYQERALPEIWNRTLEIPSESGKIVTLSGVRRSGKTFHLFGLMDRLKKNGVEARRLLYFSFEDERLQMTVDELDLILQAYRELYPDLDLSDCYFFFDEIQEVDGWEKFIARVYASVSRRVFITGSNAKLLSEDIATALRGRAITFEIYPFSFSEYAGALHPGLNPQKSADRAKLVVAFGEFMRGGGFPEVIRQEKKLREKILQEYFNVMLFRDLVERYRIPQAVMLKYFCKRIVSAGGGEFSVHKIYNELKSQGYQVSKDTLYAYCGYVDAIYLSRFVGKYSSSSVKAERSQKKVYVIDQGLGAALDYRFAQDQGRLLETTVALEFVKRGRQIAYRQSGGECDLLVIEKGEVVHAIQASVELLDVRTRDREIKSLACACAQFGLQEGTIVTLDQEEEIREGKITLSVIPAWRYFAPAQV
jgi:predicted AAA+ superfamily ATPase